MSTFDMLLTCQLIMSTCQSNDVNLSYLYVDLSDICMALTGQEPVFMIYFPKMKKGSTSQHNLKHDLRSDK